MSEQPLGAWNCILIGTFIGFMNKLLRMQGALLQGIRSTQHKSFTNRVIL